MKNGDQVSFSWTDADGKLVFGTGMVVDGGWSPNPNVAHWLVAVDPKVPGGPHELIWCAETWLTVTGSQNG